jgi:hypothetical protein
MSYSISDLSNLKQEYPTWDALRTYLEAEQFRIVNDGRYAILRYVKSKTSKQNPNLSWLRSVVWDTHLHLPVCVAPPKAEASEIPTGNQSLTIQEFLDGTMVNCFRTVDDPTTLHLATRTQLGANGTFYSTRPFSALFDDALKEMALTREDILAMLPSPTPEQPASFASFLLQHPEHRIVARIWKPKLYAVHIGTVQNDGVLTMVETLNTTHPKLAISPYPMTGFSTTTDLNAYFESLCATKGWFFQGLTFKDSAGHRWRLRNPKYELLRNLRGGEAKDMDRFLRLRKEGKVKEYLIHFPENRDSFWYLETKLRSATEQIYQSYQTVHKLRLQPLSQLSKELQPFVFRLHSHYLNTLKPRNEVVHKKDAVEIVNSAATFELRRLLTMATPPAGDEPAPIL